MLAAAASDPAPAAARRTSGSRSRGRDDDVDGVWRRVAMTACSRGRGAVLAVAQKLTCGCLVWLRSLSDGVMV